MASRANTALALVRIDNLVFVARGERVMKDSDLAVLYGITTKSLNQAVERNMDRFPKDFSFVLEDHEGRLLADRDVPPRKGRGGRRNPPRVFTEQGVAMLSSVIRSPMAIKVNIEIMRAFIRMRRLLATPGDLVTQIQELGKSVQLHDHQIKAIADVLQRMMEPPPDPQPKRKFGFHPPDRN